MARGIGGRYGIDQGGNPARAAFTPMNTAPGSPRVGQMAAPAMSSASGDIGDSPAVAMQQAAKPTYGVMSSGAVTSSNRVGR